MQVEFVYNGLTIIIQCNRNDIIGHVFQKFSIKSGANFNALSFIYKGSGNINRNLLVEQVANFEDKKRNKMNILVYDIPQSFIFTDSKNINPYIYLTNNSNSYSNSHINNYQYTNNSNQFINPIATNINKINNQNNSKIIIPLKPNIFQNFENLNKKYVQMEKEIRQKSENMKLKVEEMKKNLKKVCQVKIRFEDRKATYYGEVLQGKANGLGVLMWDNGNRFEGEFFNNDFDGIGIGYTEFGYGFGECKNGKSNGFGISNSNNGNKYEGYWVNGNQTGIGIITYNFGTIYIGQVKDGESNGAGKLIFPNGDYFIGVIDDKRRDGLTYYSQEQGIFDSKFKYNELTDEIIGEGIFYFLDGKKEKRKRIIKNDEAKWEYL